jgi:hypothetical protein
MENEPVRLLNEPQSPMDAFERAELATNLAVSFADIHADHRYNPKACPSVSTVTAIPNETRRELYMNAMTGLSQHMGLAHD